MSRFASMGRRMFAAQPWKGQARIFKVQNIPARALTTAMTEKDQLREFMSVFPDIIRELTERNDLLEVNDASKWLAEVLQYNVPAGKKNRGLILIRSYKMLEDPTRLTPENVRSAIVMGWCAEMFQAHRIILEDFVDGSSMRRGMPCWHRRVADPTWAINDAVLIQATMYSVLKKHFQRESYYGDVLHLFNDVLTKTSTGQLLKSQTIKAGRPDLATFTMKNYNTIVKYKTCYYTFQMPVLLAMMMAGMQDPEVRRQASIILLEIGQYYQIQNDFLDCFGDPALTGMSGLDIVKGRCSWLAVVALQRVNQSQRKIMEECYGTGNAEDADKIKKLYEELGLRNTYNAYEEKTYEVIITHIQQSSRGLPHELFLKIMTILFKRQS